MKVVEHNVSLDKALSMMRKKPELQFHLLLADLHIGRHKHAKKHNSCMTELIEVLCDNEIENCGSCMFLGDFFDKPSPDTESLHSGYEILSLLEKRYDTFMVSGNHVKSNYDYRDVVDLLLSVCKMRIQRPQEPKVYDLPTMAFYVIPYNPEHVVNPESLHNLLQSYTRVEGKPNICLFHLPIKNAVFDNGVVADGGCFLPSDSFSKFELTIGGDFHTPQTIRYFDSPVMYCGSPAQFSFAHKFEPIVRFLTFDKDRIRLLNVKVSELMEARHKTYYQFVKLNSANPEMPKCGNSAEKVVRVEGFRTNDDQVDQMIASMVGSYKVYDVRKRPKLGQQKVVQNDDSDILKFIDEVESVSGSNLVDSIRSYFREHYVHELNIESELRSSFITRAMELISRIGVQIEQK